MESVWDVFVMLCDGARGSELRARSIYAIPDLIYFSEPMMFLCNLPPAAG